MIEAKPSLAADESAPSHRYVTYFDKNYLAKGLTLLTSLREHDPGCRVDVVCLDGETRQALLRLDVPGVRPVDIAHFEKDDPELNKIKNERPLVEYYWSLTPTIVLRLLEDMPQGEVLTYVDADLYFWASPKPIFDEMETADVLIHGHNFPAELQHLEIYGLYSVGLICFRASKEGFKVLRWWRKKCLEWCGDYIDEDPEGGTRYGDQKYLERFAKISPAVRVCQHPGVGVAAWNHAKFSLTQNPAGQLCVDGQPVIMYHYHSFAILAPGCALPSTKSYPLTPEIVQRFHIPYLEAWEKAHQRIRAVLPNFTGGFAPQTLVPERCVLARAELAHTFSDSGLTESVPLQNSLGEPYKLFVAPQLRTAAKHRSGAFGGPSLEACLANYQRFTQKPRLLNLGCGSHTHLAWLNVDIAPSAANVHAVDLRGDWPLPENFFDVVYHSHVLEHMSEAQGVAYLHKCFAALKPGGVLRVVVPDLESIARNYLAALDSARQGIPGAEHRHTWMLLELIDQMARHHSGGDMAEYFKQVPLPEAAFVFERIGREGEHLAQALQGKPPRTHEENDPLRVGSFRLGGEVHRWMYDPWSLRRTLKAAGFTEITQVDAVTSVWPDFALFNLDADSTGLERKPDSFFMEARKPAVETAADPQTPQQLPKITYFPGKIGNWKKRFPDWNSAQHAALGYDAQSIFEKNFLAVMQVKKGQALWERDSVLFYQPNDNTVLLASLLAIAELTQGNLHILDFGGALGSTYTQHKQHFSHCPSFTWSVVEQPHYVAAGKRFFSDEHLAFFNTVEEVLQEHTINVALFSGVIQYLEFHFFVELLQKISQAGIAHVVIDRTPFRDQETIYTIQEPHSIYPGASNPMALRTFSEVDAVMRDAMYQCISSETALDGIWSDCAFLRLHYVRQENSISTKIVPRSFETVYFEISGICNGKCPYCVTGRSTATGSGKFVDPDLFEAACVKMTRLGILDERSLLHLYIWGEPTLHPDFSELLERTSHLPFGIALSTNASKVPDITEAFVQKVRSVRFSCSGFSQHSYDRIHGFRFSTIRSNIATFVQNARMHGSRAEFSFNFHIYQFNIDEIAEAKAFAQSLGILFRPNYAILNDWKLSRQWVAGTLSAQEEHRIGCDLFNDLPAQLLATRPDQYRCPQHQYLTINELGGILICCQTPSEPAYTVGNIMDADALESISNRQNTAVCRDCISSGMAYMFNNSLYCPSIFK